ncbi:MAG: hypothetical protein FWD17_08405 [Polyangiaceae bacterium]|nr:hypothetical protein [Polyangiaceae bacterium]
MRIKVVVIDLPVPPVVKRWAIRVGVAAGILGGASVVALASPKVWTAGEALKSADLNANFSDLDSRVASLEAGLPNTISTIQIEYLYPSEPMAATWGAPTQFCLQGMGTMCAGSPCNVVTAGCTIAAQHKCLDGLGFRFGFFVGDPSNDGNDGLSIACVK